MHDPDHLNRPDHEDFPALCAIMIQNDQLSVSMHAFGEDDADALFLKLTQIDGSVLAYVATNRSVLALQHIPHMVMAATSAWVDGFTAGVQWGQRRRSSVGWASWDGDNWHLSREEPTDYERHHRVFVDE